MKFKIFLNNISVSISKYMNGTIYLIFMCARMDTASLEAHIIPRWGVPAGITGCLTGECIQASAGLSIIFTSNVL